MVNEQGTPAPYITDRVSWRDRELKLTYPISCAVSLQDHLVVVEYGPLGIRAYAPTRDEALRDFAEEFVYLWDEFASTPDEELTRGALELKTCLTALVTQAGRGC